MVQLTDVEGGQVAAGMPLPLPDHSQSFFTSLEQMPHTALTSASTTPLTSPPTTSVGQQDFSSPAFPQTPSTPTSLSTLIYGTGHGAFSLVSTPCGEPAFIADEVSGIQCPTLTGFGTVDTMPSTSLDSGLCVSKGFDSQRACVSKGFDSHRVCGGSPGDGSRAFEVTPVTESPECSIGGDTQHLANHAVHFSEQADSYLLDNQLQVCRGVVDNRKHGDSYTDSGLLHDTRLDSGLLQDTRVDSVDSLTESKGYASDSSSDIYMNSDYTDTVTSADSNTFLLPAPTSINNNAESAVSEVPSSVEASAPLVSNCYSNGAYGADTDKELIAWSSEEFSQEDVTASETGEQTCEHWVVPIPEQEDTGVLADKEDEDEESQVAERVPLQTDCALENLVNHIAEQHPHEVVDIRVQVLDGPVYESLTVPLQDEEGSWLQSTDSLHRYKLLKQGRSSVANSLRVHALTNTMNNLHERSSFLNLTATSVTNLGHACQKALTYVRADMEFGSMMSLGNSVKHSSSVLAGRGQAPSDLEAVSSGKKGKAAVASGCHSRNVLYMALLVTILLVAVNTTRNLQSSLNQEGGVGIICLAVSFSSYMLGSLLSPVLVQALGVRRCVTGGLLLQLLYVAANLHPVLWLMLPASLAGGASLAVIWNAMSTYIVLLARGESHSKHKSYDRVSDKFFGIFCLIYQSNLIVGNLIASLVLTFADGPESSAAVVNGSLLNSASVNLSAPFLDDANLAATIDLTPLQEVTSEMLGMMAGDNTTPSPLAFNASTDSHYQLCGSTYCHHFVINQDASAVSQRTLYLLFGIFMFLVVVAMLIALFLLEPLTPDLLSSSSAKSWRNVRRQFVSLAKFSLNGKFLLLLPMLLYSSMQFSFVCSEVMMAYVTCPVGVWLVGYTMIGYGVCCSLSSYLTQALVKVTGRGFFIGTATGLNVGVLVFMRLWQPHPDSLLPLFIITCVLGFTDGIWNVNVNGLCGSVFPEHFEEAFTGLRVAQGLGGAFSMAYAPFFCMAVKIYIMIVIAIIVFIGYTGAEVLIRQEAKQKKQFLFDKEVV